MNGLSKYNAKKVEYKGITFDSTVECDFYKFLEKQINVGKFDHIEIQPRYELIPKKGKQRKAEYVADFALWKNNELIEVIDVKGMATPLALYKAKHFRDKYPDVQLTWICKAPKYTGKDWIEYDDLKKVRRERKKAKE